MPMHQQFLYIQLKFTQKIRTAAMPMPHQREVVIEVPRDLLQSIRAMFVERSPTRKFEKILMLTLQIKATSERRPGLKIGNSFYLTWQSDGSTAPLSAAPQSSEWLHAPSLAEGGSVAGATNPRTVSRCSLLLEFALATLKIALNGWNPTFLRPFISGIWCCYLWT